LISRTLRDGVIWHVTSGIKYNELDHI
jgi:hypothetical protein